MRDLRGEAWLDYPAADVTDGTGIRCFVCVNAVFFPVLNDRMLAWLNVKGDNV